MSSSHSSKSVSKSSCVGLHQKKLKSQKWKIIRVDCEQKPQETSKTDTLRGVNIKKNFACFPHLSKNFLYAKMTHVKNVIESIDF